jgi:hypothetical protein
VSNLPFDPLEVKLNTAREKLNRRRKRASEVSEQVNEHRSAFFDKLAILNAGALTFSVTLLNPTSPLAPSHTPLLFILYAAWMALLFALSACLVRNIAHQNYHYYDAMMDNAESEIAFLEVDREIILEKSRTVGIVYSDSPEPYNLERELEVRRKSRDGWTTSLQKSRLKVDRSVRVFRTAEWVAGISMPLGFLALIAFAVLKTYLR